MIASIPAKNQHMSFAQYGLLLLKARGDALQAVELSKHDGSIDRRVEEICRSAVESGTTSDSNWAAALAPYRQVERSFVEGLRSISAFDAMMPFARRLPLRTLVAVVTATLDGATPAEATAKPVSKLTLAPGGLEARKATALCVVSDVLLKFAAPGAVELLNTELRAGVTASTNARFLADLADGLVPIPSTGDPLADLRAGLVAVSAHGAGRYFWIVDPARAVQLATYPGAGSEPAFPAMTPSGGSIQGVTVVVSDQVPQDTNGPQSMIVDAVQLAMGDEPVTLRTTWQGDLIMDSEPGTGEQETVSMFQTNSIALLAERWFGAQRLRDSAVAVIGSGEYAPS